MERTIIDFSCASGEQTVVEAFGETKVPSAAVERVRAVVADFTAKHGDWNHAEVVRIACLVLKNMGYETQAASEDYHISF